MVSIGVDTRDFNVLLDLALKTGSKIGRNLVFITNT